MGLTMTEKQAVTCQLALEYRRATKKRKGEILDSLIQLTRDNRSYATRALRQRAHDVVLSRANIGGVAVAMVEVARTKTAEEETEPPEDLWERRRRSVAEGLADL